MASFDNRLSIILPIKDRKAYTLRILDYLNSEKCKYPIFLADGSKVKNFKKFSLKDKFKNINLTYKYHGHDKTFPKFLNKIYNYRYIIKSEYVYWLCDDDFPNLKTLKHGINKLHNNKDLSTYVGKVKNFNLSKEKIKFSGEFQYYYNKKIKKTFLSNNILKRIEKYKYFQPFEAIFNTSVFFKVFKEAALLKVDNHHEFSLIFKTIPLLDGKIFIGSKLILIRQSNTFKSEGKRLSIIDDEVRIISEANFKKIVDKLMNLLSKNFYWRKYDKEKMLKLYYENILELYNYTIRKNLISLYETKFFIAQKIYKKIVCKIKNFPESKYDYIPENNLKLFYEIKKKLT